MGINVYIYDVNGKENPDWDSMRYAGDREMVDLFHSLPHEVKHDPFDPTSYYRPTNFDEWRAAAKQREWPNPGRFELLIDIVEKNPDSWIYVSF